MLSKIVLLVLLLAAVAVAGALLSGGAPLTASPGLVKRLGTYLTTNTAQTSPQPVFPELRERYYAVPPEPLLNYVARTVRELGWEITEEKPRAYLLRAVVSTPLLHFKDDLEVRLSLLQDGGSKVHVRSASRVGKADFGANTGHIVTFFRALDEKLPSSAIR